MGETNLRHLTFPKPQGYEPIAVHGKDGCGVGDGVGAGTGAQRRRVIPRRRALRRASTA